MKWLAEHMRWFKWIRGASPEKVSGKHLESIVERTGTYGDRNYAFPTQEDTDQLEAALLTEQLRMLTDKRIDLPINMLVALLLCVIVRNLLPAWMVLLWFTLFSVVILFRALARHRFNKTQHEEEVMRRWAVLFTLNVFVTGSLWGLTAGVILIAPNPLYVVFIGFLLAGMMAGGIVSNSAYLPAMYCFMLPTIVPAIIALTMLRGAFHWPMAGMVVMFTMVQVVAGKNINRSILNNVRLRVTQSLLADELRASESVMEEMQRISQVGGIEIMPDGKTVFCTDETLRILGLTRGTFKSNIQTLIARVHPDDQAMVTEGYNGLFRNRKSDNIGCRIVMDSGEVKYVRLVGQIVQNSQSGTERFFATIQDLTVKKREEDKLSFTNLLLHTQMEASPDGILVVDPKQKIISSNSLFAQMWNISPQSIADGADDLVLASVTSQQKDSASFGERVKYLYEHPTETGHDELIALDGRYIDRQTRALFSPEGKFLGRVWFFRDITEHKLAADELTYRDRLLHAVTEGTRILVKAQSPDEGMAQALKIISEAMRLERVLVMQESGDFRRHPILRYASQTKDTADAFEITSFQPTPPEVAALNVWRTPLKEGKPVFASVDTAEAPVRRLLEWFHNKSTILLPIFVGEQFWGTLAADSTSVIRKWTNTEINTLSTFGDIGGALIVHHETQVALLTSEERFRVLGATAVDGIIMMDGVGQISSWNKAAERILGYTAQEAMGQDLHLLLTPPRFLPKAVESMKEFQATGAGQEVGITRPLIARRKDGVEIAIELSMSGAHVGTEWQAIGVLRDVTERNRIDTKLKFTNTLLSAEMEATLDGILVVDENRKVISFNKRFVQISRTPKSSLETMKDLNFLAAGKLVTKDPKTFAAVAEKLYANPLATSDDEVEMVDGSVIERHSVPLNSDTGTYLGRAWFYRDVTERRKAEALAIRSAHFDVLTGLANRSVFVEAVDIAIARVKRGGSNFAVIYLDLDHFKDVNDTLGHPIGDALLIAVAVRLLSNTRAVDTVARFGGDEFAIILADISGPADAATVADKLNNALNVPYVIRGNKIYSGASIGIDVYGPDAEDAETLLSHADVALYRTKQGGRNSYRFFTETMDKEVRIEVALGEELHEALQSDQFFLEYQPQVTVADCRIVGVEALIRWRHPKRGILGPDVFIPIAEKTGLIIKVGKWVLQTACKEMKGWIDAGIKPLRMAVNVSAIQFKSPKELEDEVINILQTTGIPAHLLELEITETVLMTVTREHNDTLAKLEEIGVTIAIDDFGTGFSSLTYLRQFAVNRIKIAQNFVLHLCSEPGDASIVRATISLAHDLGIAVIAEGVETSHQLAQLTKWGCSEVQGFYFARPLNSSEITRLLTDGGIITPKAAPKE